MNTNRQSPVVYQPQGPSTLNVKQNPVVMVQQGRIAGPSQISPLVDRTQNLSSPLVERNRTTEKRHLTEEDDGSDVENVSPPKLQCVQHEQDEPEVPWPITAVTPGEYVPLEYHSSDTR